MTPGDGLITFGKNQTTQEFINRIAADAQEIADKNDLYASVMIAQAILESSSGNSSLARDPNFNLFGIKGSFEGASVNFPTLEDNGKGSMFKINANFRKYPSYRESLEDYAKLLTGGIRSTTSYYAGAWKSNTENYREATLFLTGKYATDTQYNKKLNGLIQTYELEQYDDAPKVTRKVKVTRYTLKDKETLWDVVTKHGVTLSRLKELNKWDEKMPTLTKGDKLIVKREVYVPEKKAAKPAQANKAATKQQADNKATHQSVESKELILLRASKLGFSVKSAIPSALFEDENPMIGRPIQENKIYQVAKEDSISSIAKKARVSIEDLVSWNNLENSILSEGQVLLIANPFG